MVSSPILLPAAITGLVPSGLAVRGGFHPDPGDAVPPFADGAPTATVVLLGWTGGDQWHAFAASPEAADGLPDPLDRWATRLIDEIATRLDAIAFYPFGGPPWLDFIGWGLKAEPMHRSPLGLLIHPRWGLWHSYRGALGFRERLTLAAEPPAPSPCERCAGRPCLSACPVAAFAPDRAYDHAACRQHLDGAGEDCRRHACAARRACPVAPAARYCDEQAEFHIRAFRGTRAALKGEAG